MYINIWKVTYYNEDRIKGNTIEIFVPSDVNQADVARKHAGADSVWFTLEKGDVIFPVLQEDEELGRLPSPPKPSSAIKGGL